MCVCVCARVWCNPLTGVCTYLRDRRSHLTSALGAVIDGPLVFVLVYDAVVEADADAVLNQLVLIRLGGNDKTRIWFIDYLC